MVRVLQVTSHDVTVKKLLLPLIDRLTAEGYHVVSACTPGRYTQGLLAQGYDIRPIAMARRITPVSNLRSIWRLYRLMRREHFDVVHVHTPVAAVLGRVAARLAGIPIIIYTAHGFYFHDHMTWGTKKAYILIEKLLGRTATDALFTQSQEDAATAVQEGICRAGRVEWIGNGVDVRQFDPGPSDPATKGAFGLPPSALVIGFMGRMVAEKGVLELLAAFQHALAVVPNLYLLLAGATTDGDRDRRTGGLIQSTVRGQKLGSRIVFPGFVEDVNRLMRATDLFVLPSYREGMPRSIIEAMASGKPVIATNIRGCREEVVHGVTGLLVAVRDSQALAEAMVRILSDSALARSMGNAGRLRAQQLFDEHEVLDRQIKIYRQLLNQRLQREVLTGPGAQASEGKYRRVGGRGNRRVYVVVKRGIDIVASAGALLILALPLLLVALAIKLDSRGSVFYRQERAGKNGRSFQMLKFRTMVPNAERLGLRFEVAQGDSRITRVGRFLRGWSLDELPQLYNVLKGEMSLVGPRAARMDQVEQFTAREKERMRITPGLTGWAQVNGRNLISWKRRIELDLWYVDHEAFWLDLKILLKTVWVVFVARTGRYGPEGITRDYGS